VMCCGCVAVTATPSRVHNAGDWAVWGRTTGARVWSNRTRAKNRKFVSRGFFKYVIQHCFICRPSDSTVSEDAGIEPGTVATLVLTARRSNHSARSRQLIQQNSHCVSIVQ
jgi:hypothetical protein